MPVSPREARGIGRRPLVLRPLAMLLSASGLSQAALLVVLSIALAGQAAAQTWTKLAPTGGPPPFRCYGASTVYDPGSNRLILFGGNSCAGFSFNDVWVLTNADGTGDNPQWIQLSPLSPEGVPPTARNNHTAVYDAANNRMIIYSGCTAGCTPIVNDVWVLINANGLAVPAWTQLSTVGIPAGRNNHKAAYDPLTNRMIMFGGQDGGGFLSTVFEEVWVLTNANGLGVGTRTWSLLSPTGAPASGTIGYYIGAMVYDSAANRMTVFGGAPKTPPAVSTDRNSVWVLSNANGVGTPGWTNTVAQDAAGSPPSQAGGAFVNDTANNIATLYNFLGSPAIPRTWTLSHVNGLGGPSVWTEIFPGGGSPGPVHLNSSAYNAASNRMIVFTNSATQANTNEVWVLGAATLTSIAVTPANPTIVVGQTQQFTATGTFSDGSARVLTSEDTWETKAPMPTPRGAMVGGEVNGILYVAGGHDGVSSGVATNEAYDTVTDTWTTKASMPTPRYGLSGGVVNGILYAVAGQLGLTSLATVEAYDPTTDTWTSKAPLPTPRNRLAGDVVNGTLYIVGGCIDIACAIFVSTVHAYDPLSDTWTAKTEMPTPRRNFAVGVVDGILYAVGGAQGPGPSAFLTTVEAYDPATDTWTTKAPLPVGRDNHAAVGLNGKLYVVGGITPGQIFTDTIHVYDPTTDTWTTAAPLPTLRCCPFTAAVEGTLYAIGGTDFTGVNEVFTPAEVVWSSSNAGVASIAPSGLATGLTAGTTTITATSQTSSVSGSTTLTVIAGSISGRVTQADGITGISGARVEAHPDPGGTFGSAMTAPDGTYTITGLATGVYRVQAQAEGFVTSWYNGKLVHHLADPVLVTAGFTTTGVNFALQGGAGGFGGRITQSDGTTAIPNGGVSIHLADGGFVLFVPVVTIGPPELIGTYTTGLRLAPGSYKAQAQVEGFANLWFDGALTSNAATPITVTANQTTTGINFRLPVGGGITGRITNANTGLPVGGATIEVLEPITNNFVTGAFSALNGTYSTGKRLAAGSYKVSARAPGFVKRFYNAKPDINTADPVIVVGNIDTLNIDIALTPGRTISGFITRAGTSPAQPLAGATIDVFDAATNAFVEGGFVSSASGFYTTEGRLPPGRYKVRSRLAGFVTTFHFQKFTFETADAVDVITADAANTNIALSPGRTISGFITRPGTGPSPAQPLVGAVIDVFDAATNRFVECCFFSDSNGFYTTEGRLPPGSYKVRARLAGFTTTFFNQKFTFDTADAVDVTTTDASNINIALAPGRTISGFITRVGTTTPLAGAVIEVFEAATNLFVAGGGDFISDTSGFYTTEGRLPPGRYKVRARLAGFASTFYNQKFTFETADVVDVTLADATANIALSPGRTISGFITRAGTTTPLAGATVDIFDASTNRFVECCFFSDSTGFYTTEGRLPPGVYKVRARLAGFVSTFFDNKFTFETAIPVDVTATDRDLINFALAVGGGITGRVTHAVTPFPALAGAIIDVFEAATNRFVEGGFVTDSNGFYTTERRLATGSYKVRARLDGFATTFYNDRRTFSAADPVSVVAGADATGIDFALQVAGGITGTVTRADTSAPLENAIVDVFEFDPQTKTSTFIAGGFRTNASGFYSTGRQLLPGTYKVRARVNPPLSFVDTFHANGIDFFTATVVTVIAAQDIPNINMAMPRGGIITGIIRDRLSGNPIAGASVFTIRVAASSFFAITTVQTDQNGTFTFRNLRDGDWLIRASAPGRITAWFSGDPNKLGTDFATATPVQISGANTVTNVDMNLVAGGAVIQGRITRSNPDGPVPAGTVVTLRGPTFFTRSFLTTTTTDSNGMYSFAGVGPGQYIIEARGNQRDGGTAIGWYPTGSTSRSTAIPVMITGSETAPVTRDFTVLGFSPGTSPRTIKGFVQDSSGNPLSDAQIIAFDPAHLGVVLVVRVNGDGSYTLDGLPRGKYVLRADTETTYVSTASGCEGVPPGPFRCQHVLGAGTVVDATAANQENINLFLAATAGTLTGTVTTSTGQPIMGASVSVQNFFGNGVGTGATTRHNGFFLVRGLPRGHYKVRVVAPGFVTRHYTATATPSGGFLFNDASFVPVQSGLETSGINVMLDPAPGAITGSVLLQAAPPPAGPVPLVGAFVQVREATTGSTVLTVVTQADGIFTAPTLATGSYKLRIFSLAGGFAGQWFNGQLTLRAGDTVAVTAPGTTDVGNVVVSAAHGSISGQVFRIDGVTKLADAGVVIFDAATGDFVWGGGVTDTNGNYRVHGLAPTAGSYVVQARALGFARKFFGGAPPALEGVPNLADAALITVTNGADTPGTNFKLTLTSDITGAVSYVGTQTGPLRVELFSDEALTQRLYAATVTTPAAFPRTYSFVSPPPDTQGIIPGTYFVAAYIDANGNGVRDGSEPVGHFGSSPPIAVVVGEGLTLANRNIALADPADLVVSKTASSDPVVQGGTLTYTISVTNNGLVTATTVTLTDQLPSTVLFVSAFTTQGTCPTLPPVGGTGTVTCDLGSLAPGATATVTIAVTPTVLGPLSNTASVTSAETEGNPANNTSTALTTVRAPSANLAIGKTGPTSVTVGSNLTYALTVTNQGPDTATGVTVTDMLPPGVTFVSASPGCSLTTPTTVTCTLGSLGNGASATVTITVSVTATGTITNTASVTAAEGDPDLTNNTATHTAIASAAPADLALTKSGSSAIVAVGNQLAYTVTVVNNGPGAASGVTVTDTLPAGATLVSASASCTTTNPVSCSIGSLASGASATVTIVVTATLAGVFTNTATVTAVEPDPSAANNAGTHVATVVVGSTTSRALSTPFIVTPPAGGTASSAQAVGDVEIAENAAGVLRPTGRISLLLPAGLTFGALPTVSLIASNGLTIATGLNAPRLEAGNQSFSFAVATSSSSGPARLLITGLSVIVQPGFAPGAVLVTLDGPTAGLTSASVQVATAVAPSNIPTLADVSPSSAGQGAGSVTSYMVTLIGANLAANATVDFGAGISVVPGSAVLNSLGTELTVSIAVNPLAVRTCGLGETPAPGVCTPPRDVTVTNPPTTSDPFSQSSKLTGIFSVTAAPTITSTDRQGTGVTAEQTTCSKALFRNSGSQAVRIFGAGFGSPAQQALVVEFGTGITVGAVSFVSPTEISADVTVDANATLGSRVVTVINPDGGTRTSAIGVVDVDDLATSVFPPCVAVAAGLGAPKNTSSGTTTTPTISGLSTAAGLIGSDVTISGSDFGPTAADNSVTFAGSGNTRVAATVKSASSTSLIVTVPSGAVDGAVNVAVNGVVATVATAGANNFTVTNPRLSAVLPSSAVLGTAVTVDLTGTKFVNGATVTVSPATGLSVGAATFIDSGRLQVLFTTVSLGRYDVTVTNLDGGVSTLAGAFEVKEQPRVEVTLVSLASESTYRPSVDAVSATLDSAGKCTAKTVTPTAVTVQARWAITGTPPASLTFKLASSNFAGTATNEDCELVLEAGTFVVPTTATSDFSISALGGAADVTIQELPVNETSPGSGLYQATLYSWDWGGNVRIDVIDSAVAGVVLGSLTLPADQDGDLLPDFYENDTALNANAAGANVLDRLNPDQDGNGTRDSDDRFARDGLSNHEKYRGIYLTGPIKGGSGSLGGHTRLGSGMLNLFARGRGFSDDPALTAGTCGINPTTGAPVADTTLSATNPCPPFSVGDAYAAVRVKVHNVTASFTTSTILPTRSLADPTKATLDMATVVYDGVNCYGFESCDVISKTGTRQWSFATLGFSAFGTATAYGGDIRVFKRSVEAYFNSKPYEHRKNDPNGTGLTIGPDGRPMLAPITSVGDNSSRGADNGLLDSKEGVGTDGQLLGDTYVAGSFNLQLSVMDANNDGCVELPFVTDPTTISDRCAAAAASAVSPQATKSQVVQHLTTHELGHGVGVNIHTSDSSDVMYQYTINWTRAGHFSQDAANLIQIHNKGLQ